MQSRPASNSYDLTLTGLCNGSNLCVLHMMVGAVSRLVGDAWGSLLLHLRSCVLKIAAFAGVASAICPVATANLQGSLDDEDWPAAPVLAVADRVILEVNVFELLRP